jgi:membrane protease YdiL (CAAX protease family)
MRRLLSLLALTTDPNSLRPESAVPTPPEVFWTPGTAMICAMGLSLLISWQGAYGGFAALQRAPVRRNRMVGLEPVILLSVWLLSMMGIGLAINHGFAASGGSREGLMYPAIFLLDVLLIAAMLLIARRTFARRLKGFGLSMRTLGKDAGWAAVYLAAVYPLVIGSIWGVLTVGRFIKDDFAIEVHESLTFLSGNTNLFLQILAVAAVVVVVPVFEEMLFRGFLQTAIRSVTQSPWTAIVLTSALFSILHPPTHIPALFCLSCGLGYAYERSGSLFRSIFMHILFNGLSVAASFLTA